MWVLHKYGLEVRGMFISSDFASLPVCVFLWPGCSSHVSACAWAPTSICLPSSLVPMNKVYLTCLRLAFSSASWPLVNLDLSWHQIMDFTQGWEGGREVRKGVGENNWNTLYILRLHVKEQI